MAELKRKVDEEELTTADLAGTNTTTPETERRPQLVRNDDRLPSDELLPEKNETVDSRVAADRAAMASGTHIDNHQPAALFGENEVSEFRNRWSDIQTGFVDEPRKAVENADNLVASLMKKLAEGFANERAGLEKQWDQGTNVSTEDLRVALQRYRSFFDRLLKV